MPNHLANESSPYLLQHSNNPVDWFPWGAEALARARNEDKPIFLSIGYSACHWCHVMEHESFEDESIAALMNEHFINIKVDREERPDLDSIYMSATVSMTGSGGWPMSVFLTPDLRPFYAGTYFPPTPRFNMPSFRDLLTSISQAWQHQRDEIFRVGDQVTEHIQRANKANDKAVWPLTQGLLANAAEELYKSYDWSFGGWGEAPKFPQPMTIEFLLCQATRDVDGKDGITVESRQRYIKTVSHVLQAMCRGGMYDVVGGGFARYSVDNLWKTPHFEKMLYDNAQLAQVYLHGYLVTGEEKFRQICEETLDFILREMTHPAGGFFSSLDADSEGQEGKFYIWDFSELQTILGSDMGFFEAAYGLSNSYTKQSPEGKIILQRVMNEQALQSRFKLSPIELRRKFIQCHTRLLEARNQRIRPGMDDKILTGWNALALAAFAEAGRYLSRPDYLDAALRNAHFLLDNLRVDGRLKRSWRDKTVKQDVFLEDYAGLILGLLALYQSIAEPDWFFVAKNLADEMVSHFNDPQGGFFDIRDDHENLLLKPKDTQDNATPSGNALAATALLQLAEYEDKPDWRNTAEEMLGSILPTAVRYPSAFAKWLCAADFALGPTRQVAVIGDPHQPETQAMLSVLWKNYQPRQVTAVSIDPASEKSPMLLKDRSMINGLPTAFVCRDFICQLPVTSPKKFSELLGKH